MQIRYIVMHSLRSRPRFKAWPGPETKVMQTKELNINSRLRAEIGPYPKITIDTHNYTVLLSILRVRNLICMLINEPKLTSRKIDPLQSNYCVLERSCAILI